MNTRVKPRYSKLFGFGDRAFCEKCGFLIVLLYHTGMRIGEALNLRHSDIHSEMGRNEIHIVPRDNNSNGARVKNSQSRIITVSDQTEIKKLSQFSTNQKIETFLNK